MPDPRLLPGDDGTGSDPNNKTALDLTQLINDEVLGHTVLRTASSAGLRVSEGTPALEVPPLLPVPSPSPWGNRAGFMFCNRNCQILPL